MSMNGGASPAIPRTPYTPTAASRTVQTDDPEDWVKQDPHLSTSAQQARRTASGLVGAQVRKFATSHEFVGLGNYCAVARALQALGLRKFSYMFDWGRSPLDGIIHLVENDFADFLSPSTRKSKDGHTVYSCSGWGGSFWHHDITNPKTVADLQRRVDRFYGNKEVSATQPRVFVRACNGSGELALIPDLVEVLMDALPEAPIKLLVLVDIQSSKKLFHVRSESLEDVVFAFIPSEHAFLRQNAEIEDFSSLYADAIAKAVLFWSAGRTENQDVHEVASLDELRSLCVPFHGQSALDELYAPRRLRPTSPPHPSKGLRLPVNQKPPLPARVASPSRQVSGSVLTGSRGMHGALSHSPLGQPRASSQPRLLDDSDSVSVPGHLSPERPLRTTMRDVASPSRQHNDSVLTPSPGMQGAGNLTPVRPSRAGLASRDASQARLVDGCGSASAPGTRLAGSVGPMPTRDGVSPTRHHNDSVLAPSPGHHVVGGASPTKLSRGAPPAGDAVSPARHMNDSVLAPSAGMHLHGQPGVHHTGSARRAAVSGRESSPTRQQSGSALVSGQGVDRQVRQPAVVRAGFSSVPFPGPRGSAPVSQPQRQPVSMSGYGGYPPFSPGFKCRSVASAGQRR